MRIDPALRALRSDPASQRAAQAALEGVKADWQARPEVARLLTDLRAYGEGAALTDCPALDTAMALADEARALVDALVEPMQASLRDHPLGQVPFRHQYSGGIGVLQLVESGRAAISLLTYEGAAMARFASPQTVCFSAGERNEVYLAGSAEARVFEILSDEGRRVVMDCERRRLVAGETLSLAGARHTKIVDRVEGRLVMLRLGRGDERLEPAREFRISDGELVHQASADVRESRAEMAMALLGRMERTDALPQFERLALQGSDHLRWQALRECLALDTERGFRALSRVAEDANDTLGTAAGALRAQLLEAHPALSRQECAPCRG
ncbi:MAG: hypothetical protein ACR2FJ_04990 [Qipengyuania sp.]